MAKKRFSKIEREDMIATLVDLFPGEVFNKKSGVKLAEILAVASGPKNMSTVLSKYRAGYVIGVTPSGRKSRHTGDEVALSLEGNDAATVIKAAEILLGLERGTLVEKYEGMGPGHARMNAGNRIRGAFKRGEATIVEIDKALASKA